MQRGKKIRDSYLKILTYYQFTISKFWDSYLESLTYYLEILTFYLEILR